MFNIEQTYWQQLAQIGKMIIALPAGDDNTVDFFEICLLLLQCLQPGDVVVEMHLDVGHRQGLAEGTFEGTGTPKIVEYCPEEFELRLWDESIDVCKGKHITIK